MARTISTFCFCFVGLLILSQMPVRSQQKSDSSPAESAGWIEELQGTVKWRKSPSVPEQLLGASDRYRKLHEGEAVRCMPGCVLKIWINGSIVKVEEAAGWYQVPKATVNREVIEHEFRRGGRYAEMREPGHDPLTTEKVIELLQAGLPEDAIIARIKTGPNRINLSGDDLNALKSAGGGIGLIAALAEAESPDAPGGIQQASVIERPVPTVVPDPGEDFSTARRVSRDLAVKAASSAQKHTNIAFLVGIGDYDRALTGLPRLKYPVPDIMSIGGILRGEGYEVSLLIDGQATAGAIKERFKDLSTQLDKGEGTFLFYFSGHGFRVGAENYLATYGTTTADLANQGLSLSTIQKLLLDTGARHRMAFVDACRNDPDAKSAASPRSFADLQEAEGLRILYSTAPDGVSYEDENLQHGVFSYFLIQGLTGKAANLTDGLITFDDLRDYVTREMKRYSIAKGRIQKPYQLGESNGDFLVAKAAAPEVAAPATPPIAGATPDRVRQAPKIPLRVVRVFETGTVHAAALSPDGRLVASAGTDGSVQLWSIESGKRVASLTGPPKPAVSIQFSPDSKLVVASGDKAVWLWEVETKIVHKLEDKGISTILSSAFSPDRKFLAACGMDKTVRVWNLETAKVQSTLKLQGPALWAAFAPSSDVLGVVDSESKHSVARLWNWRSQEMMTLLPDSFGVRTLAFSLDGRKLVGGLQNGLIRSWDLPEGERPQQGNEFEGHTDFVESLVFSPEGKLFASAGADKTFRWWDLGTAGQLRSLDAPARTEKILSLSFAADGRLLAATARVAGIEILQVPSP
jgi:hypothetical protein